VITSDAEIDAAIARGRLYAMPHAVEALYDRTADDVVVRFDNGVRMAVPRRLLQGLETASRDELREVVIAGPGTGLYWPKLDVGHYIPGLVDGVFGTRKWMQQLGKRGGAVKSPAKSAAARENGKKGGRPKKIA